MITTDTPVVLIRDPNRDPLEGVGLATAAGILVPLDRRAALAMTAIGTSDRAVPGTTAIARDFNHRLAWQARRAIFHHPEDDPLDGMALPQPREREIHADGLDEFLAAQRSRRLE
ncbi:MAG TPA: DUF4238 domain-containing protein [Pseudonocardiaceae bacterium]|nr:DUF4238 domain-containing protein [Pseudonocardiaceae bacterium]